MKGDPGLIPSWAFSLDRFVGHIGFRIWIEVRFINQKALDGIDDM